MYGSNGLGLCGLRYLPMSGGALSGPLTVPNGTAASPGIRFALEPSGWYLGATRTVRLALNGSDALTITYSALTFALNGSEIVTLGNNGTYCFNGRTRLRSPADGKLTITNSAATAPSTIQSAVEVEAIPGNDTLTNLESGKVVTNEGATAQSEYTLPTAAAGLVFEFVTQDADGMKIICAAGDTLRAGAFVSAAGGYGRSAAAGNYLRIVCINDTEWVVVASIGTWTLDS